MADSPKPKRPYALMRAAISGWLLVWAIGLFAFIVMQFGRQPLFNWGFASLWIGASIIGWIIVYRVLQRLRKMPSE